MDVEERVRLVTRNAEEVVTLDELKNLLETTERPKGYIGYEPSGLVHIGWIITTNKVIDFVKAGFDFTILLADLHAYANEKLEGVLENIRMCAKYMEHTFTALGVPKDKVRYLLATEFVENMGAEYLEMMIRIARSATLTRIKRSLTILGRKIEEAEMKFSMLIYPPMQAADVFLLNVDVAYGGMDQRSVHMLCRDVAPKLGRRKPIAVHTPLLSGLAGIGRMDVTGKSKEEILLDTKMSKSIPETCIFVHDTPEDIRKKIRQAYCPPKDIEFNPVMEINKYLLFARDGFILEIHRPEKYGGDLIVESYPKLEQIYLKGDLHPLDLKNATAEALIQFLKPVREYFEKNSEAKELLLRLQKIKRTR